MMTAPEWSRRLPNWLLPTTIVVGLLVLIGAGWMMFRSSSANAGAETRPNIFEDVQVKQ